MTKKKKFEKYRAKHRKQLKRFKPPPAAEPVSMERMALGITLGMFFTSMLPESFVAKVFSRVKMDPEALDENASVTDK